MTERRHEGTGDLRRFVVDPERAGVDWTVQRAAINERIAAGQGRRHLSRWLLATATAAVLAALLFVPLTDDHRHEEEVAAIDADLFLEEVDAMVDDYVPQGLYVLNGYEIERSSFEERLNYLVPQVSGEEAL